MKVIDLTMPISANTPIFPGDPKPQIKQIFFLTKDGFNQHEFTFSSHLSTHIDAPYHMISDGKRLDEFPIDKFWGEGTVIDVRGIQNIDMNKLDEVHTDDIVFFCTNQTKKIHTDSFFKDAPMITKKTAELLIKKKVKIIGIDSFSPDSEPYEVHKLLLKNEILIVENLMNLENLIGKRIQFFILPLNVSHVDGAPCRVIAMVAK